MLNSILIYFNYRVSFMITYTFMFLLLLQYGCVLHCNIYGTLHINILALYFKHLYNYLYLFN
jgi:hypothetical protein